MRHVWLLLFLPLLTSISCSKDFLDTQPSGATLKENAFKTTSDFESALNGCYSELQSVGYYGRNYPIIGEILADNIKPSTDNLARFTDLYNYSQTASDQYLKEFWKSGYAVIHRCNTLIKEVKQDSVILTDAEHNIYLGQALGLRALAHFDLFNVFSPRYDAATAKEMLSIPLVIDSTFEKGTYPVSKATTSVLISQILKDAKESRILLDKQTFSPLYFNKYAAMALHARVSLYMGDYGRAAYYADSVTWYGNFTLVKNEDYIAKWSEKFSSESIFTIAFDQNDFNGTESLGYLYSENGYGDMIPTSDISRQFESKDVRKGLIHNGYCNKFKNSDNTTGLSNFPVFRVSEMYLSASEAIVRLKLTGLYNLMDEGAIKQLDQIRMRADTSAKETKSHGKDLLEIILSERRKELCFEGQRFFDMKRMNASVIRQDCSSQKCTLDSVTSYLFTMPIPISEINANQNIAQNEGY